MEQQGAAAAALPAELLLIIFAQTKPGPLGSVSVGYQFPPFPMPVLDLADR